MRILMIHNTYLQRGGEDAVFEAERDLLRKHGHAVECLVHSNEEISRWNVLQRLVRVVWNQPVYREIQEKIREFHPEVVHVHNLFHAISPAVYYACRRLGVPVVQTLHNFRLFCLNGLFFRDGHVCEDCVGARRPSPPGSSGGSAADRVLRRSRFKQFFPWPGIIHRCYRQSLSGSLAVTGMLIVHRLLRTWARQVDGFIALTPFSRDQFAACGLPAEKIRVKPNFLMEVPGAAPEERQPYALFVGRLSPEKGCAVLLQAWAFFEQASGPDARSRTPDAGGDQPRLLIVGDGPERARLEKLSAGLFPADSARPGPVGFLGRRLPDEIQRRLRAARFLLLPSLWYEGFPVTIVEAFAHSLPVVASALGSMNSVIVDRQNGLLFKAGDAGDLAAKIAWAWAHPQALQAMGQQAREDFEKKYSAEVNYETLMTVYAQVNRPSGESPREA